MDYPGKVITKNQVTPTQTSATGVWTLDDAAAAVKNNTWPVAGVPNPISKSLRFNSADTAYLNRTPASAGNRQIFTYSGWIKRSKLGTQQFIIDASAGNGTRLYFNSSDQLGFDTNAAVVLVTTPVYRDVSAWYHVLLAVDTTQATASNRVKLYVNGTQVTVFGTSAYPAQNTNTDMNNTNTHYIGRNVNANQDYIDAYETEIYLIDGQALTPSSFGMTDPQTGAWEPIKYTGTYGTNGFYLNFKDATSTTTLGYDYSGNANNWTTNNFSVTAGSGNDSLTDVPTPWIAYNTTGDVGGVVRGNYATLNPLNATGVTITNGNLNVVGVQPSGTKGTIGVSSGKWYWETVFTATAVVGSGIGLANASNSTAPGADANSWSILSSGNKFHNGTQTSYGSSISLNDVIGIAVDLDAGKVWWSLNGTFQASGNPASGTNEAFSGISGTVFPMVSAAGTDYTCNYNFGQRPFAYTPPAGFLSLCTTNLPNPTIGTSTTTQANDYFGVGLWAGDGVNGRDITNLYEFNPDFVWIKNRTNAIDHNAADILRGWKELYPNLTSAEGSQQMNAPANNGLDGLPNSNGYNASGSNYVSWVWKANGAGVTNTAGSITSTVSANTTAGFSVVTFTATGSNATVGHGLGVAPKMIITKQRNVTGSWATYHESLGNTKIIYLNSTGAALGPSSAYWNNTSPTSTVFTFGGALASNTDTIVAYCWSEVAGYSAFGSYTGNGSTDGPFVYTGFRPRYLLTKESSASGQEWFIWDAVRNPYNQVDNELFANSAVAENSTSWTYQPYIDFLSNGFKLRSQNSHINGSGSTLIYAAFAEFPFKFANAR